ncbi:MAG: hypothetical protein E7497_04905 [Ruminococcus sp.]|nr:hypothetical protein [Ruminococcus sp.]
MKKKVKIIKTALVVLLSIIVICITIFVCYYFKGKKELNEISKIKTTYCYGYLYPTYTYEIDFISNTITCTSYSFNSTNIEDSFSTSFSEEDAAYFIKYANLYGFFNWKETYTKHGVQDGIIVNINIEYVDKSNRTVECYAEFPNTFDKMQEVFYEAFGYNML